MSAQTGIAWCDSTFNPWIGCTKVSPACDHCYAERDMAIRRKVVEWGAGKPRHRTSPENWKQPVRWNKEWFLQCSHCGNRQGVNKTTAPKELPMVCRGCGRDDVWSQRVRRRVFCASLADVFDNEVMPSWRLDLFDLIERTSNLDWLLLTKRIGNVPSMTPRWAAHGWPKNVWLGSTVVTQEEADRDAPKLLNVPAAVRFLSIEPMLGAMDVRPWIGSGNAGAGGAWCRGLDWVIAGGESGPKARASEREWFRSIRDQCQAAGVPFHFKQWGEWRLNFYTDDQGDEIPGTAWADRMGKKIAGRDLDGRTWDEFPRSAA